MTRLNVKFYPLEGENNSPVEFLLSLDAKSLTTIQKHLEKFAEIAHEEWPRSWSKKHTGPIRQTTCGDFRALFIVDPPYMVILHIFRKKGRKTHPGDTARAENNYEAYLNDPRRSNP